MPQKKGESLPLPWTDPYALPTTPKIAQRGAQTYGTLLQTDQELAIALLKNPELKNGFVGTTPVSFFQSDDFDKTTLDDLSTQLGPQSGFVIQPSGITHPGDFLLINLNAVRHLQATNPQIFLQKTKHTRWMVEALAAHFSPNGKKDPHSHNKHLQYYLLQGVPLAMAADYFEYLEAITGLQKLGIETEDLETFQTPNDTSLIIRQKIELFSKLSQGAKLSDRQTKLILNHTRIFTPFLSEPVDSFNAFRDLQYVAELAQLHLTSGIETQARTYGASLSFSA